jgi:hypothetical protein
MPLNLQSRASVEIFSAPKALITLAVLPLAEFRALAPAVATDHYGIVPWVLRSEAGGVNFGFDCGERSPARYWLLARGFCIAHNQITLAVYVLAIIFIGLTTFSVYV